MLPMVHARGSRSNKAIRSLDSSEAPAIFRSVTVRSPDRDDPILRPLPIVPRGMDAPADVVLVVDMSGALAFQSGDLVLQSCLLHQAAITGGDRLGHGELVGLAADILNATDAAVAGERRGDEPGLALVVLPHRRVHRAQRGVGIEFDLVVLVALPLDPPFPLLDMRRQPWHIEMVQGLQALLHIDAGAHRLGRADEDADTPGVELVEQALLVGSMAVQR